jgi:hypothetical protein
MYLRELDDVARELFVEAALLMVRSDDEVAGQEDELLDAISAETGLPVMTDEARRIEDLEADLDENVQGSRARRIVLLELAGVAVVDARRTSSEMRLLERLAEKLGLSDEIERFVSYAEQVRDVAEQGEALLRQPKA